MATVTTFTDRLCPPCGQRMTPQTMIRAPSRKSRAGKARAEQWQGSAEACSVFTLHALLSASSCLFQELGGCCYSALRLLRLCSMLIGPCRHFAILVYCRLQSGVQAPPQRLQSDMAHRGSSIDTGRTIGVSFPRKHSCKTANFLIKTAASPRRGNNRCS